MSEKFPIPGTAIGWFLGWSAALGISQLTGNTDQDVKNVQIQNEQLQTELSQSFDDVSELILNLDGKKFAFVDGERACAGEYEVTDDIAHVAGQIACTVEIDTEQG